jgi:hypothetical protein
MTQFTDEQLEVVSQGAAAKLQAFCDGLTEEERLALDRAARRLIAGGDTDTQGHMIRQDRVQPISVPDPAEGKPMPYVIFFPVTSTTSR